MSHQAVTKFTSEQFVSEFDLAREQIEKKYSAMLESMEVLEQETVDGPIPDDEYKKSFTCHTHGEQVAIYTPIFDSPRQMINAAMNKQKPQKHKIKFLCSHCAKEVEAAKAAELAAVNKSEYADRKSKHDLVMIEKSGVSKRNENASLLSISPCNDKQAQAIDVAKAIMEKVSAGEVAPNLILCGGVGTGKTLIGSALVCDLIRAGRVAIMSTVMTVIRDYRATWKNDCDYSEAQYIKKMTKADLLVIDEVGVQYGSDSEKLFLFDVIDGRYQNQLPTILLSNLNVEGIRECIGARCLDRLREDGGKAIGFDGPSLRGK